MSHSVKIMMYNIKMLTHFQQLSQFVQSNGHCGFPSNFPESPDLLEWISQQHSSYFAGNNSGDCVSSYHRGCLVIEYHYARL